eukprot:COSAG01_NODE_49004_length_376_cov_0.516245_1_plen_21_part_01
MAARLSAEGNFLLLLWITGRR